MKDWLIKYWLQVLFGFIVAGFGIGYKKIINMISDQKSLKLAVQALLRNMIIQNYNHYIEKGTLPIYALENINALYGSYHALGGNGAITELMEKIKDLPTEGRSE